MKKAFLFLLIFLMAFSASAEYAYIATVDYDTYVTYVLEYDTESKEHKLYSTNAYPIKDDIQGVQMLAERKDNGFFDLYYISDGKLELFKSDLFCSGFLLAIAYMDQYVYCLRKNDLGNNEIIRISPDGDMDIYCSPDESIYYPFSTDDSIWDIAVAADVDKEGRVLITSYDADDESDSAVYMALPNGEYHYISKGYYPFWYSEDVIMFLTCEVNGPYKDEYINKYTISTGKTERICDIYVEYLNRDDYLISPDSDGMSVNGSGEIIINTFYLSWRKGRLPCYITVNIETGEKEKIIINERDVSMNFIRTCWEGNCDI